MFSWKCLPNDLLHRNIYHQTTKLIVTKMCNKYSVLQYFLLNAATLPYNCRGILEWNVGTNQRKGMKGMGLGHWLIVWKCVWMRIKLRNIVLSRLTELCVTLNPFSRCKPDLQLQISMAVNRFMFSNIQMTLSKQVLYYAVYLPMHALWTII